MPPLNPRDTTDDCPTCAGLLKMIVGLELAAADQQRVIDTLTAKLRQAEYHEANRMDRQTGFNTMYIGE